MTDERAAVERKTITGEHDSTTAARQRLQTLAAEITGEIVNWVSRAPIVRWQNGIFEILQRAGFDAGREGVTLADQSLVKELAVAIATIEELEPYALLAKRALETWAHEFQPGGRVAGLTIGDSILVKGPLLLIERGEAMRLRLEDLAKEKANLQREVEEPPKPLLIYAICTECGAYIVDPPWLRASPAKPEERVRHRDHHVCGAKEGAPEPCPGPAIIGRD